MYKIELQKIITNKQINSFKKKLKKYDVNKIYDIF